MVLNGPNLNLLGIHNPSKRAQVTLEEVEATCVRACQMHGLALDFRQTNHEGDLIDALQEGAHREASGRSIGVVLNAGGYAHTSVALHDAILGSGVSVVELNIANIYTREAFRHHSYVSLVAKAVVGGFGQESYSLAIAGLLALAGHSVDTIDQG